MKPHFANCADFALGLREQFGKSSKSGNGKLDFMAAVAAALTSGKAEMLQLMLLLLLRQADFCHIYNI